MLIVCDTFKEKKVFTVQENKRNVYPWETNMFSDGSAGAMFYMPRIDLKLNSGCVRLGNPDLDLKILIFGDKIRFQTLRLIEKPKIQILRFIFGFLNRTHPV